MGRRRRKRKKQERARDRSEGPMAADFSNWVTIAVNAVLVFFLFAFAVALVVECVATDIEEWWQSPRMRLYRLGGVTTLRRKLNYLCTLCQDSMEAGEKVRTLSCDHVFHCGGGVKCENDIDQWLLTGQAMSWQSCPICRQVPHRVLPWKRPPPSSPAPSPSASAPTSTSDLEEALLLPVHWLDEALPEASSSQ